MVGSCRCVNIFYVPVLKDLLYFKIPLSRYTDLLSKLIALFLYREFVQRIILDFSLWTSQVLHQSESVNFHSQKALANKQNDIV